MNPGFFALPDPDPGFKSPDPSINKIMDLNDVLIRFWRSLNKKGSVKSARHEI